MRHGNIKKPRKNNSFLKKPKPEHKPPKEKAGFKIEREKIREKKCMYKKM